MPTDVTRDEFDHLKARVDTVEREVEGEKIVTRHILEQTRHNSDDLAAIKSRLDRHDQRFDALERKFDGLERKFDGLERKVDGLERKFDGLERKVDGLERKFDGLERKVDGLDLKFNRLTRDLPTTVADVMCQVLRERDEKA